ncbi:MAG: cyclophilin-like fold protein [Bacillota bacterium]
MSRRISISAGNIKVEAVLNATATADAIWAALPITGRANRWGSEIYFEIPVRLASENAKDVVEAGDLGYWPPGRAFCIFFGPTPVSRGNEIRAASPVNVFGRVEGEAKVLRSVRDGAEVVVTALQE